MILCNLFNTSYSRIVPYLIKVSLDHSLIVDCYWNHWLSSVCVTGLTGCSDRSDRSAQNRPNCFYDVPKRLYPNAICSCVLISISFGLRNISRMPKQYERRTKCLYDSTSDVHMADADEGGSSHPNVTVGGH